MENVIRTIYAGHLQNCKMLNRPFSVLPNSTLNQKFSLFQNELPATNEYPVLGYLAIGNKGASYEVTPTNYILTTQVPHLPRHSSLYNFIPFVVRNIADDISASERTKYRMRVPVSIGGVTYVCYYLRALTLQDVIPSIELRNVNEGTITTTTFSPTLSDLSPTPPDLSNVNLNNPNGDYLAATAKISLTLNQSDLQEIMDGCAILYSDPRYAVINEIALVTGIDRVLQGTFGNVISNYTEVIASQIAAFIYQYHAITSNSTEVQIDLDVGSMEPLLV